MHLRMRSVFSGSVVAIAIAAALFNGSPGAVATDDQAVLAGDVNTEAYGATIVHNTSEGNPDCPAAGSESDGLIACGEIGLEGRGRFFGVAGIGNLIAVEGDGGDYGVRGFGTQVGVEGANSADNAVGVRGTSKDRWGVEGISDDGYGVYGHNSGTTGAGVYGETAGVGSGVYGIASQNGVAVFGDSTIGVGLQGRSTSGPALNVLGKAVFSRSGLAYVPAGTKKIQVHMSRVTTSSMVLATVQQSGGFYVTYVVPAQGRFTIFINKAPVSPNVVKVAFFVLN